MRIGGGQARGRVLGHDVDPALDRREEVLEARERGVLRFGARGQQRAALEGAAQLLGLGGVEPRREVLERVGVDVDAAGEVGHLRDDVQAQPPRVAEQARVGELADGGVQRELVVGDLEVATEVGEVLRQDRGHAVGHDRDADIAAADDLLREVADDLAELRGEERSADGAHQAARALDETLHVVGRLLAERGGQRVGDARRDRLGELLPERQRRLDPPAAGHRLRRSRELRDRRGLAQPQRRERERLVEVGALAGR